MTSPSPIAPENPAVPSRVSAAGAGARSWQRYLPLAAVALAMGLVFINDWHKLLTLENVAELRDRFQAFLAEHQLLAVLAYIASYTVAVALSVPGALFITIAGGLMFGALLGGAAAVVGASCGAILLYLVAKTAFGDALRAKAGPALAKLIDGFKSDALNYLLFLRLVPAFPFFVVNIAAAVLGVPLRTYIIGTVFGIIPATFAFASIGAGLDSIIAAARSEQTACIAAKGAAACKLAINPGTLVTRELLLAFALLGFISLIPVAYKKWSARHG